MRPGAGVRADRGQRHQRPRRERPALRPSCQRAVRNRLSKRPQTLRGHPRQDDQRRAPQHSPTTASEQLADTPPPYSHLFFPENPRGAIRDTRRISEEAPSRSRPASGWCPCRTPAADSLEVFRAVTEQRPPRPHRPRGRRLAAERSRNRRRPALPLITCRGPLVARRSGPAAARWRVRRRASGWGSRRGRRCGRGRRYREAVFRGLPGRRSA
jgi:hypothetical protein